MYMHITVLNGYVYVNMYIRIYYNTVHSYTYLFKKTKVKSWKHNYLESYDHHKIAPPRNNVCSIRNIFLYSEQFKIENCVVSFLRDTLYISKWKKIHATCEEKFMSSED